MTEIIALKSLEYHQQRKKLMEMVSIAIKHFPELNYVYVGIDKRGKEWVASADPPNNIIKFGINKHPTYVSIFHELMHLVQHSNSSMPKTEEFCSIYAMARMPEGLVDENSIPYIGSCNKMSEVPSICKMAIKYRETGKRDYINFVRRKLESVT